MCVLSTRRREYRAKVCELVVLADFLPTICLLLHLSVPIYSSDRALIRKHPQPGVDSALRNLLVFFFFLPSSNMGQDIRLKRQVFMLLCVNMLLYSFIFLYRYFNSKFFFNITAQYFFCFLNCWNFVDVPTKLFTMQS